MASKIENWLSRGNALGQRFTPAVPRRTPHGTVGAQLGRNPGESLEFVDFRDYQPGDDLRRLDWSAYARSDSLVVRVYREEIAPHMDIVLDASASMAVREPKHAATVTLAGLIAGASDNGRYTRKCWSVGDECHEVENSTMPVNQWQLPPATGTRDSGQVFASTPPRFHPHGVRVFISDLLFATDPEMIATVLAREASVAAVVHLLDREDRDPPTDGAFRLVDSETGEVRELRVDEGVQRRYLQRLDQHIRQWQIACQKRGILFVSVDAEKILDGDADSLLRAGVLICQ